MKIRLRSLGLTTLLTLAMGACTTPQKSGHIHEHTYGSHGDHDDDHDHGMTHQHRQISSDFENGEIAFHNHPELGVKLDPDSPFCDLNENGKIDADELAQGPLCRESAKGSAIFALKPIVNFGLKKGELILTTDDGPNPVVSPRVYDILKSYGIHGTFFLTGSLIAKNASLIQRLVREGHTVGNHTYSHNVPNITDKTIKSEIHQAHEAVMLALAQAPDAEELKNKFNERLLFRAPGLGWNAAKGLTLNSDTQDITYQYIGPIHANLGTDAPRADWSCWSKGVSAADCAQWYFEDIVNTGRGVVLSHDVFYKSSDDKRNTAEMLRILLQKLDNEGGGICNKPNAKASCVWTFRTFKDPEQQATYQNLIADSSYLESKGHVVVPTPAATPVAAPTQNTSGTITNFKTTAVVRSESLRNYNEINDSVKAATNTGLSTNDLAAVIDLHQDYSIGTAVFKYVRIVGLKSGNSAYLNTNVYIWEKAF